MRPLPYPETVWAIPPNQQHIDIVKTEKLHRGIPTDPEFVIILISGGTNAVLLGGDSRVLHYRNARIDGRECAIGRAALSPAVNLTYADASMFAGTNH